MAHGARRDPPSGTTLGLADAALRDVALRRGLVTMAMARGPPLHRRPHGAGAAETTSWAVGGAPHMSSTPIWLVGHRGQAAIAATGVSEYSYGFHLHCHPHCHPHCHYKCTGTTRSSSM